MPGKNKTLSRRTLWAAAIVALLALTLFGAWLFFETHPLRDHPLATLHGEEDAGYIPVSAEPLELEISAPQAFVYDCESETLIYRKGEDRVVYPASTTKLLTALCALEYLSPDEIVTPGDELSLVEAGSSLAYIKEHHAISVEMLVEGMLLPSGNDAAYVLAAAAGHRMDESKTGKDAVAVFMDGMAAYGERMGLVGTQFTTPDGYADSEHYSTVEDIVLISRLAMENEIIRRYAAMHEHNVAYASGHINHWVNTNELIDPESTWYHAAVTGLKTGSLENNYCLIFTFEQDGHAYIAGVFGAAKKHDRYADAHRILNALLGDGEVAT